MLSRMEPCIVYNQRTIILCSYCSGSHKTRYKVNQAIFCKKKKISLGNCMDVNCKNVVGSSSLWHP